MAREKKKRTVRYQKYSDKVKEAVDYILDVREGKVIPVKTGRPWLDDVFPLLNKSVITIGAGSGVGKSYELMKLMDNVLNTDINPSAGNYAWLNFSLEMKVESLALRSLSKDMKVKKTDILYGDLTDDQIDEFNKLIAQMEEDERTYIIQDPTSPQQFRDDCEDFLEENSDKESVFISLDHIALFGSDNGENRNQTIENAVMHINDIKLRYPNVIFIILSQLNRDREKRLLDKNIMSQPKSSDLYYSEFIFQISDYVYIMVNPMKDKLTEYSYVIAEMYPHLEDYFLDVDKKGRTPLETIGVIYYHILKFRDADYGDFVDIYAEELYVRNKEVLREQRNKDKKPGAAAVFDEALGSVVLKKDVKRVEATRGSLPKLFDDLPEEDTVNIPPPLQNVTQAFGVEDPVQTRPKVFKTPF